MSVRVLEPVVVPGGGGADGLEQTRRCVQKRLEAAALAGGMAPPRRFVLAWDGYWDGYTYRIDPCFAGLAEEVTRHRAE